MRQIAWISCLVIAAAVGCSDGSGAPECETKDQCGDGQACLSTGVCALACTGDEICGAEGRCGPSGGCISKLACGEGPQCRSDQICSLDVCVAEDSPEANACGAEAFATVKVPSNMHVLLDRSSSMSDTINVNGTEKSLWSIAVSTLKTTTTTLEGQLRFGLQLFPIKTKCTPGPVLVPVGDRTASAISAALPAGDPTLSLGTPLAASLTAAGKLPELADTRRANYVLLLTDGEETCQGNPANAAAALLKKGIRTYVVGFGAGVDGAVLSEVARAGGTGRAGSKAYYQADSAADLDLALSAISRGAAACDFALGSTPPDKDQLYVYVNGQKVSRDASHAAGWDYDAAGNRVTFYGTTCEALANDTAAQVKVVYGCAGGVLG